jgi:hypothetical protein
MSDEEGTAVVPASSGGGVAAYDPERDGLIGLEDFSADDVVLPRYSIVMAEAKFKDSLSGAMLDKLEDVVILGYVEQRVLWDPDEQGSAPLCKSVDGKIGYANNKTFPWKQAGLAASDFDDEVPRISCADCKLKEWGTMPGKESPWCADQKTLIILAPVPGTDSLAPALLTLQRSSIRPVNAYFSGFMRAKQPAFTATTTITLTAQKRGSVEYAVPAFVRTGDTAEAEWGEYVAQYRQIRDFLHTPPANDQAPEEPATPAATGSTDSGDDDEVPF